MALNRKYAALPDLDSAPDIYETPELTDDASTVPTTLQSHSDHEFEDDDTEEGISRSRLRIDQARSRFMPSHVDAKDVDFSDRVNGKRKSYKASSRRQRILQDGTEELGDLSDEDESESLARKIARLKREIEEAKEEYGKQRAADKKPEAQGEAQAEEELASLSQVLDEMSKHPEDLAQGLGFRPVRTATRLEKEATENGSNEAAGDASATYTVTYAPSYEQTHALAKAADFDQRLALLEKSIGIGSSALPELDSSGLPRAIVPTLEKLQKQVSTLSEASSSSLDTISRKVRQLTQEAEQLEKSRRQAKQAKEALATTGNTGATSPAMPDSEDSEQTTKINALYSTLPTIESLTPLLPPLLDRLRSLRVVHADAATASETLDRIEKRQSDMAADIRQWREGLEKIEAAIKSGEASMGQNTKVVEGWVKDLEEKMAKLS